MTFQMRRKWLDIRLKWESIRNKILQRIKVVADKLNLMEENKKRLNNFEK